MKKGIIEILFLALLFSLTWLGLIIVSWVSMHDLEQRREIINEYKKQIKDFQDLLKNEDKSLKQLEDKI